MSLAGASALVRRAIVDCMRACDTQQSRDVARRHATLIDTESFSGIQMKRAVFDTCFDPASLDAGMRLRGCGTGRGLRIGVTVQCKPESRDTAAVQQRLAAALTRALRCTIETDDIEVSWVGLGWELVMD